MGGRLWDNFEGIPCECAKKGGAKVFLFRTCFGIEYEDKHSPVLYRLRDIHLEPSWKAFIQRNSFSVAPLCFAELRVIPVDDNSGATTLLFKSDQILGWEVSRAIQFCWLAVNNELSERCFVQASCNRFADVALVWSKLPVEETCTMSIDHRAAKSQGKLKLENDGVLRFFTIQGVASEWVLDDIIMMRRVGGITESLEMKILVADSQVATVTFSNFVDFKTIEETLCKAWCLCCNSIVNFRLSPTPVLTESPLSSPRNDESNVISPRIDASYTPSPHRKKRHSPYAAKIRELPDKVCFSVEEVMKLLATFQSMDEDRNGKLNKAEWVSSLGPVFKHTQVPHAVFSVFDTDSDEVISFPEFLFGCRVLHLGSHEDRLQYQYRIFDPTGQGWMTVQQFYQVAQTLREAVGLNVPNGVTLQQYCVTLFNKMDRNHDGKVDMLEFKDAISENDAFKAAFQGLADARVTSSEKTKIQMGNPVWFGDTQWLQCTAILLGIKLSQDNRLNLQVERGSAPKTSENFKRSAWMEKVTWELGTQQIVETNKIQKKAASQTAAHEDPTSPNPHPEVTKRNVPPLVQYESYFTDYSPQVFQAIQERFNVSPDSYKSSLGIEQLHSSLLVGALSNLNTMTSSGKSGAFFFASHDGKFILKTVPKAEGKVLRRFLPSYYQHIMENPDTLLTRYFGLHALSFANEKIYFLVMNNVIQPPQHLPIQITYDLKGSTVNRTTPLDRRKEAVALKDLDFKRKLEVSPDSRKKLMAQIRADSTLLQKEQLNDYSLLIGIHCHEGEITDGHQQGTPFWSSFHGGLASQDRREVYYVGIIDLLTAYNIKKKTEYTVKSLYYRTGKVSCVPPEDYKERFVQFIEHIFPATTHNSDGFLLNAGRRDNGFAAGGGNGGAGSEEVNREYASFSSQRANPVSPFGGSDFPDMLESPLSSPLTRGFH